MKNYLLFTVIFFVMGCGSDKKVELHNERNFGKVREIHTTFYEGESIRQSSNIPSKYVDSFDVKGNILKKTKYIYDILYNKYGDMQWENEGSKLVIRQKFRLNGIVINNYDSEFGLTKTEILDKNGKLEEVYEYKKLNDTTISVTEFDKNRKRKGWRSITIDDENIVVSDAIFDEDSTLIFTFKPNRLKGKLISNLVIRKDKSKTKNTFKYISFDKEGNWIEREAIENLDDAGKYKLITKAKRVISYYK